MTTEEKYSAAIKRITDEYRKLVYSKDFDKKLLFSISHGSCLICGGDKVSDGLCISCGMMVSDKSLFKKVQQEYEVAVTVKRRKRN